jgi:hypothetical protein
MFWYFASISATPDLVLTEVRTCIDQFIFNRSPCRISRADSVLPVACGGVAAPHIEGYLLALKARWICLYLRNPFSLWARFFRWKIDKICSTTGISQPFSANLPASIKNFGVVGEALYAWSILPKSPDFRICSADLADSFPISSNRDLLLSKKLRNCLSRSGIFELQDLLSDSGGWLTSADIRSQYHTRIPEPTLRSIQSAIPNRFIMAATVGHTKISVGDWLESRCDSSLSPFYLQVTEKTKVFLRGKKLARGDGSILTLSNDPIATYTLSEVESLFRKVFVISINNCHCLIGDLYQRAVILSKSSGERDAPRLIDLDFRSLRVLYLPPHRFSTPKITLADFNYERAYKWLSNSIHDLPLRAFCLRLIHRKIPLRLDSLCFLCSTSHPSFDHVFQGCDVVDAFLEYFSYKCSLWFPDFPFIWSRPLTFDTPYDDTWNLAAVCAKSAILAQYWHLSNDPPSSPAASSHVATARRWLKKLREFLLVTSLKGIKSRNRWNRNGLWILADGSLNMDYLSL